MKIVENSILSTDLAMYFKKKNRFMELVENGEFDWQSEEKKEREQNFLVFNNFFVFFPSCILVPAIKIKLLQPTANLKFRIKNETSR